MPDLSLANLTQEILSYCWQNNPVYATGLGIREFDYDYANYSTEFRQAYHQQLQAYVDQLATIATEQLSTIEQTDLQILTAHLKSTLYKETEQCLLETNPSLYPTEALLGVQSLQINYNLPIDHRVLAIIGRLKSIPQLLKQGQENLSRQPENISKASISHALNSLDNGKQFLEDILPPFSGTVPHYFMDLLDSNTVALKAMKEFEGFLHALEPKSRDDFACGKTCFEHLLKEKYLLDDSMESLLELGEDSLAHTEKLLHEVAEELSPGIAWQQQIQNLKNQYPEPENLLNYYKKEAERIRDFGIQNKLFTVPEDETLVIMETPIFQRAIMPYSGYVSPAPFEAHQTGYFWVTPVNDKMDEDERLLRLRAHNIYDVILTNVHHAYPGQHLLFVRNNQHPSAVRKAFPDLFFAAGWPLYCEEMLYTEELYTDLKTRLFQLKDQLWRDCRLILDVKLHMGNINYSQAVQMLVDKVGMDPVSAAGEVKRYILEPTVGCGYLVGKREIIRLRQEVADLQGDNFDLGAFHDTLLSFGTIPLPLLRQHVLSHYQ